ncbi:MAG: YfhO family protein [Armatimonadetes bacterium]|nr:YfhO family protein [Armatimonadota bacterium]
MDKQSATSTKSRSRSALAAVLLLAVLTLLIYHGVVFRPGVIYGRDTALQGYPLAWFEVETLKNWDVPGWFPYMLSGFPLTTASPFYPSDYLVRFFPVTRFVTWRYILHTFAAAVMMFLMLRRFKRGYTASVIGGMCFGFSAFFISKVYAGHGLALWTGTWLPLTILFLDLAIDTGRPRYAVLSGAVLGLQILGQHPQYVFYSLLALLLFGLWRVVPRLAREPKAGKAASFFGLGALVGLFAFLISSPHLLPFLQMMNLSNRGGGTGYDYASSLSMHPAQLITAAVPSFWGNPAMQNSVFGALYWDAAMYIGVIPLLLAAAAFIWSRDPKAKYFKALAVISLVIALGKHTPLFTWIYHIPGFDMIRAPGKILFLYAFAAAALAAYGADLLVASADRVSASPERKKVGRLFICSFIVFAAVLVVWIVGREHIFSVAETAIISTRGDSTDAFGKLGGLYSLQVASLAWTTLFAAVGAVVVAAASRTRIRPGAAGVVIASVIFLDLYMYADPLLYTHNARKLYASGDRGAIAAVQSDPDRFRILPLDTAVFQYAQGVFDNLESVNGYMPISIARYANYVGAINGTPGYVDVSADIQNFESPLVGLLNVKYVLSSQELASKHLTEVFSGRAHVYRNNRWLPRAFIVHQSKRVADADLALREITSSSFDPLNTVIVESDGPVPKVYGDSSNDRVRFLSYSANDIRIAADMGSPGYLFLSEVYYPDWRAWVDGKPARILPANYLFRAVYLPRGRHEVRMSFVSSRYRIGSGMAVSSLVFIAGMIAVERRRRVG